MKTSAITLLAALTTAGMCLGTAARAQDYEDLASEEIESLDITAQRLPNYTPVAISGSVLESSRGKLVLQRADGVVTAQMPMSPLMTDEHGKSVLLTHQLQIGDPVTVYGRVQKDRIQRNSDTLRVKAEGIYAQTTPRTATLYMLNQPKTVTASKINSQVPTRMMLRRFEAHFTPL